MRALIRLALVPVLALVVLGACSGSEDGDEAELTPPSAEEPASSGTPQATPEPFRGFPEGLEEAPSSPAGILVGEEGLIYVVTFGSSSNPKVVRGAIARGQTVVVDISDVPGRPSTMDYSPTTSAFHLPDGVDISQTTTFILSEFGQVVLGTVTSGEQAWVEVPD